MSQTNLDKMLGDLYSGKPTYIIKWYIVGMWLITDDYNNKGFITDIIVCKGKNKEEALKEAKEFEDKTKYITAEKYMILSCGKNVLKATLNAGRIYELVSKIGVAPDNEEILKLNKEAEEYDRQLS